MAVVAVAPCLSGNHYRRAEASGGRITTQNNCRILQSFPMNKGEAKEEVTIISPQKSSNLRAIYYFLP